ncbi:MAG: plasmid mobilization relaxosome protein MobC [Hymenobacteraceae bacterium]|nr:plasmid mobilization relaxosome protein MobC [Hymenobacteraceae bacterium]
MSEPENNRTRWLHLRLSPAEYERLHRQFRQSTCRKLSHYARRKLLDKPVTVLYRNQSMDAFMAETMRLRQELGHLGSNFNQAVKKLHTLSQIAEFREWLLTWEMERTLLLRRVEEIKNRINTIADQWLQ